MRAALLVLLIAGMVWLGVQIVDTAVQIERARQVTHLLKGE